MLVMWLWEEKKIRGDEIRGTATFLYERAAKARESFNARFWNPARGFLFDVVDGENGDSDLCRPNQVLSISLENPVLAREHWAPVMKATGRSLTPRRRGTARGSRRAARRARR